MHFYNKYESLKKLIQQKENLINLYNTHIMRFKIFTVTFLVVLFALTLGQKEEEQNKNPSKTDVIQLLPTNFQETIDPSTDPWLLYLYAPWCQHCKIMAPEWEKLATNLKGRIKVAKINPSDNAHRPKFHKLFKLVSFPHIILLHEGPKSEGEYDVYEGARTAALMEEWAVQRMKIHKALAVGRIVEQRVWEENCIETDSSVCIVALLPSLLDASQQQRSVYVQILKAVANSYRDKPVSFLWAGAGDHPEFEALFNLNSGYPAVILLNPQRRVFTTMKTGLTEENVQEWLQGVFRSKGGRHFNRYSKEITFSTVSVDKQTEEVLTSDEL